MSGLIKTLLKVFGVVSTALFSKQAIEDISRNSVERAKIEAANPVTKVTAKYANLWKYGVFGMVFVLLLNLLKK